MKKTLGLILSIAFAIAAISAPVLAGQQPDDAIKARLDKNPAFTDCNGSAITNGHVVFGERSAINPLAGSASDHANTAASAVDVPQTALACDLRDSQRVEPKAWWD